MKYLLILALAGCSQGVAYIPPVSSTHQMSCVEITGAISRCENKETICYIWAGYYRGGMQCHFKVEEY
jgi:hypothetical protein